MNFIKNNLTPILFIAIAVIATWQIRGCMTPSPPNEELIIAKERIKILEEKRMNDSVILVQTRMFYDSLVSLSKEKSSQLSKQYQSTKVIYEKIPVIVNSYDREQLRNAVSNY